MTLQRFVRSFRAAAAGLLFISQTQLNWRIHWAISLVAFSAGIYFRIEPVEWAILILTIGAVLCLEALNTAIEATVDAQPGGYSEDKRHAKDAAAAAVLVGALMAIAVGTAIFGPRILSLRP
jgi:diacylglycerol kinase